MIHEPGSLYLGMGQMVLEKLHPQILQSEFLSNFAGLAIPNCFTATFQSFYIS